MTKLKLVVRGMHCGSCAMSIDDALEELEGVAEAKTSYRKQTTKVVFDETRIELSQIESLIRSLGYEAAGA